MARLSNISRTQLERGRDTFFLGGFYTRDRSERDCCERLRRRGLLKFFDGRRARDWRNQFYTITETGRAALTRT